MFELIKRIFKRKQKTDYYPGINIPLKEFKKITSSCHNKEEEYIDVYEDWD